MLMVFRLACSTVAIRLLALRLCGEMDITTVFGTVVPGSNPGGGTQKKFIRLLDFPHLQLGILLKNERECETI